MQKLLELERKFDELAIEARQHWSKEEGRMQLVDQFVNPSLEIDHVLHELHRVLDRQRQEFNELRRAVMLHLSDPGQSAPSAPVTREVNGEHRRKAS
jgi:hypothetical protein